MSEKIVDESYSLAMSTVLVMLLFGTNFLLYLIFQLVNFNTKTNEDGLKVEKKSKISKPFIGTLECFTNLTSEVFRLGVIMSLTYICENHWFFEHSGKEYSRDLFLFVLILFFAYAFFTIKPTQDLTLLSRGQSEEWKGWMQFIFLLYHYFHAEEVYNSVRVMITCYVWMTGFGNFSFFWIKQDFGWLRVVQMLWRLNFSVLLLMWTHGNTYILYYICPMHTFYFLMVYTTMYAFSSVNHSRWGIRIKLMVLGVIIFIIWDVNGGIFDFVFAWLGSDSIIGAGRGSVWEYYFRTSLDHWSSFLGMIFALNFPLAEQYFVKAKGTPLILASVIMGLLTVWWYSNYYVLEKMEYNLTHSYFAIIPLTSYIFFRNLTPAIRSGISMSLHDLGKTTLETYLLQHHIWLTSNAKTLLTIVPNHPWINFALATMLFFTVSKELYRLTMTLRGMMLPDDKTITIKNMLGMLGSICVLAPMAFILHSYSASLFQISLACVGLMLVCLLIINRFARSVSDSFLFQQWSNRACTLAAMFLLVGIVSIGITNNYKKSDSTSINFNFIGAQSSCLNSISDGHWEKINCNSSPIPMINKIAFCETNSWIWDSSVCPVGRISTQKANSIFNGKKIAFIGDSIVRNAFHQFNKILDPEYVEDTSFSQKHNTFNSIPSTMPNTTVSFVWAPFIGNVTNVLKVSSSLSHYDFTVSGAAAWDALYDRDIRKYSNALNNFGNTIARSAKKTINVWMLPTTIIDNKLSTQDKKDFMNENTIQKYRESFQTSSAAAYFNVIIDPTKVSETHGSGSTDGVHYNDEVYAVMAQMAANSYTMNFAQYYVYKKTQIKSLPPQITGSMSFPSYGLIVLTFAAIMLFSMDGFLGVGFLSLRIFGRAYDWDAAYGPLMKTINGCKQDNLNKEENAKLLDEKSGDDSKI